MSKLLKQSIALFAILLFVNVVYAQNITNTTTTTTPSPLSGLKDVYTFLLSINPILLLVLGVVLILASKLAKFVGIVLIIIALIHLLFMFLK